MVMATTMMMMVVVVVVIVVGVMMMMMLLVVVMVMMMMMMPSVVGIGAVGQDQEQKASRKVGNLLARAWLLEWRTSAS